MAGGKFLFCGLEWIAHVDRVMRELLAEYGNAEKSMSIGVICIDGKTGRVEPGRLEDDVDGLSEWMMEFHNRMAIVTA